MKRLQCSIHGRPVLLERRGLVLTGRTLSHRNTLRQARGDSTGSQVLLAQ